jgi:hypothetical protein
VPVKQLDRPKFWIVAGPNGSGKSTLYTGATIKDFNRSVWIINPDLLTARIRAVESIGLQKANLESVRRIYTWLEASIAAHQTVGVETVLSTDKYRNPPRDPEIRRLERRAGEDTRRRRRTSRRKAENHQASGEVVATASLVS